MKRKSLLIISCSIGLLAALLTLNYKFSNRVEMTEALIVKVVDEKTKKPATNVEVKVGYVVAELTPGGASYHIIKSEDSKTDDTGTFRISSIATPRPTNYLIYQKKYWGTFYTFSKNGKVLKNEQVPVGAGSNITIELADSAN